MTITHEDAKDILRCTALLADGALFEFRHYSVDCWIYSGGELPYKFVKRFENRKEAGRFMATCGYTDKIIWQGVVR